jgi:hypothetical protein
VQPPGGGCTNCIHPGGSSMQLASLYRQGVS